MSRIAIFLVGVAIAAAGSAAAVCDTTTCSSCVVTGTVSVCVNYTAPPAPPSCSASCTTNKPACPLTVCTTACTTVCGLCVRGLLGGTCVSATFGTGVILASQSSLDSGLDLGSLFSSPTVVTVDAAASGTVASNAIVTLSGATPIANLNVGSGFSSGAIFQVDSSITVTTWTNNAGSAKVDNNGGNLVVTTLSVGGSSFSVFQNGVAVVSLVNVDFTPRTLFSGTATLHLAGGVAHIGANGATSGTVTGTGNLKLSGGVSVDGNIPQGVTIQVNAAGSSAPLAVVDASAKLNISGNVQGTGSIVVNGQFILGSTTASVDPKVVVNAGATLVINSATALQAKAVDIYASATLVIGANANKAAVYVEKMAKCLGTVQIKLAVTAAAFISGSSAGAGVGFTYSSNNVPADLKNCAVQVIDSNGLVISLTSTTTASAGRRLLASGGTATWGANSMTYTVNQQSAAAVSFGLVPVMVIGVIGLLV